MTFKKSIALLLSGSMLAAAALTGSCLQHSRQRPVRPDPGTGQHHGCHGGYLGPLDLSR